MSSRRLQTIAKHLIASQIPEGERSLHINDRLVMIAQQEMNYEEFFSFSHKFIDFRKYNFPEVDPVVLKSHDFDGKEVYLKNYRYPSLLPKRLGIVFFVHGYGEYVQRYAYLAQYFAEQGYDFVGIDQRGFGYSEGFRGLIQSDDAVVEDLARHIESVDAKYGGEGVKKFIVGYSLGGLMSIRLNALKPNFFTSMALIAPYLGLLHRAKFEKFNATLEEMNKKNPTKRVLLFPVKPLPPEHILHFMLEPMNESREICIRNLFVLLTAPKKISEDVISKASLPLIVCLGKKEQIVDNKICEQFYSSCSHEKKQMVYYEDQDHFLFHDNEQAPRITSDIISFFKKFS